MIIQEIINLKLIINIIKEKLIILYKEKYLFFKKFQLIFIILFALINKYKINILIIIIFILRFHAMP